MGSVSSYGSGSSRPKTYLCDFENCDKAYSRPSLLEQHKRSHTDERPFKCPHEGCDKSFLRNTHLKAHEVSHRNQQDKPFHCSICGKGVNSPQHLKRHEITHTKSFVCSYENCDESFYKHQSLRHHILSVHERSLTCTICNKTFNRPYKLAQHNLRFHSETPSYQCDFKGCFRNFKTWSALQLHIKTDHPKLKCTICGKGCVGRQGLNSHMMSHNNDQTVKLWNCEYCNLGQFVKKIDLINHYHEFHDGNLPYSLLNSQEKYDLENLSNNIETNLDSLRKLKSFDDLQSPLENNEIDHRDSASGDHKRSPIDNNDGTKSENSLNSLQLSLNKGHSIIDLLLKNYNHRQLPCPKTKCGRFFAKEYDLRRHLKWHEDQNRKVTAYLESLNDPKTETNINDYNENDINEEIDMNDLIDDELKLLQEKSMNKT